MHKKEETKQKHGKMANVQKKKLQPKIVTISNNPNESRAETYRKECHLTDDFFCEFDETTQTSRVLKFEHDPDPLFPNKVRPCCVSENKDGKVIFERERADLLTKIIRMQARITTSYETVETAEGELSKLKIDIKQFKDLKDDLDITVRQLQEQLHICLEPLYDSQYNILNFLPEKVCEPMNEIILKIESAFFPRMFALEALIGDARDKLAAESNAAKVHSWLSYFFQGAKQALKGIGDLLVTAFNFVYTYGTAGLRRLIGAIGPSMRDVLIAVCKLKTDEDTARYFKFMQSFIGKALENKVVRAQLLNAFQYFTTKAGKMLLNFIAKTVKTISTQIKTSETEKTTTTENKTNEIAYAESNLQQIADSIEKDATLEMPTNKEARVEKMKKWFYIVCVFSLNALKTLIGVSRTFVCAPMNAVLWYFQRQNGDKILEFKKADAIALEEVGGQEAFDAVKKEIRDLHAQVELARIAKNSVTTEASENAKLQTEFNEWEMLYNEGLGKLTKLEEKREKIRNGRLTEIEAGKDLTSDDNKEIATWQAAKTEEPEGDSNVPNIGLQEANDDADVELLPTLTIPNDTIEKVILTPSEQKNQPPNIEHTGAVVTVLFKFFMFFTKNDFFPKEELTKDLEKYREMSKNPEDVKKNKVGTLPSIPPYVRYTFCRAQPQFKENLPENIEACEYFADDSGIIDGDDTAAVRQEAYIKQAETDFEAQQEEQRAAEIAKLTKTEPEIRNEILQTINELQEKYPPPSAKVVTQPPITVAIPATSVTTVAKPLSLVQIREIQAQRAAAKQAALSQPAVVTQLPKTTPIITQLQPPITVAIPVTVAKPLSLAQIREIQAQRAAAKQAAQQN